jgi:hypothetical protein
MNFIIRRIISENCSTIQVALYCFYMIELCKFLLALSIFVFFLFSGLMVVSKTTRKNKETTPFPPSMMWWWLVERRRLSSSDHRQAHRHVESSASVVELSMSVKSGKR